ncbi:MAG: ribbon-helix-helix domain-containing protein [Nanoarchaeota archaeon]
MNDIEILNVRLPSEIVQWLDSLVEKGIYNSRSEAIREFCREHIAQFKDNTGVDNSA